MASSLNKVDTSSCFKLLQPLGKGGFGLVYKAEKYRFNDALDVINFCGIEQNDDEFKSCPNLEKIFALKFIPCGQLDEVEQLKTICHPNIVQCYNAYPDEDDDEMIRNLPEMQALLPTTNSCATKNYDDETDMEIDDAKISAKYLVLQLEFCSEGTLDAWIVKRKPEEWEGNRHPQSVAIFTQLSQAVHYLELKSQAHGDLKLNNVLLTRDWDGFLVAKLGDFGLASCHHFDNENYEDEDSDEGESECSLRMRQLIEKFVSGRRLFQSPEQARYICLERNGQDAGEGGPTHASDIYSLGLIWICLLCPFSTIEEAKSAISSCMDPVEKRIYPSHIFQACFSSELSLIKRTIDFNPSNRPHGNEIMKFLKINETYSSRFYYDKDSVQAEKIQMSRRKMEKMLKTFEYVSNTSSTLLPVFQALRPRKVNMLLKLLHEAQRFPLKSGGILPTDNLVIKALEYLDEYNVSKKDNVTNASDVIVLCGRFVGDMEILGLEMKGDVLRMHYRLACDLVFMSDDNYKEDGMRILQSVIMSSAYNEMDTCDTYRLEIFGVYIMAKAGSWDHGYNYQDNIENKITFQTNEEAATVLAEVMELYDKFGSLHQTSAVKDSISGNLFSAIIKILAKLGRETEAEGKLRNILAPYEIAGNSKVEGVDYYADELDTVTYIKCNFLGYRCNRLDEAISTIKSICDKHVEEGHIEQALDDFIRIREFLQFKIDNVDGDYTDCNDEWKKYQWMMHHLAPRSEEWKNLLVDCQLDEPQTK